MQAEDNEQCSRHRVHASAVQQQNSQVDCGALLHMHASNASSLTRQGQNFQSDQRQLDFNLHQGGMFEHLPRKEQYYSHIQEGQMRQPTELERHQDAERAGQEPSRVEATSGTRTPKTLSQVMGKATTTSQYGNGIVKTTSSSQSRSGCVTTRTKYLSNYQKDKHSSHRAAYDTTQASEQMRQRQQKASELQYRKPSLLNDAFKQQSDQIDQQLRQFRSNAQHNVHPSYSANRSGAASRSNFQPNSHKSSSVIGTQGSSAHFVKCKHDAQPVPVKVGSHTMAQKPKLAVVTNEALGLSTVASTAGGTALQSSSAIMKRADSSASLSNTSHLNSKKYLTTAIRSSQLLAQHRHQSEIAVLNKSGKQASNCATQRGAGPTVGSGPMGPLGLKKTKTASPMAHQQTNSQKQMSHIIASNINCGLNTSNLRQTEFRVIQEMINGPSSNQAPKKKPTKPNAAEQSPPKQQSQPRARSGGSHASQQANSKARKPTQTRNGEQQLPVTPITMNHSLLNQIHLEEQPAINSSRVHVPERYSLYTRAQQPRVFPKSPSAISNDAKKSQGDLHKNLSRQPSSSLYQNYREQVSRVGQNSRTYSTNVGQSIIPPTQSQTPSGQQSRCGALASHRTHQRANPSLIQQPGLTTSLETISEKRAQQTQQIKKQLEQTQQCGAILSLNQGSSQAKRKLGQTQVVSSKHYSQTPNLNQSSTVIGASNKNVKGMSNSREKRRPNYSGQAAAPRKQAFGSSGTMCNIGVINDGIASGLTSARALGPDQDTSGHQQDQTVSNKKAAKRRDFVQENKRAYAQPAKAFEDPKYATQRLKSNGCSGAREVLSSRITPSKQIFRKDKKKNSLSKSPSAHAIKQVTTRGTLPSEQDRDMMKKAAQTHRPDQIAEILRGLNQSMTGKLSSQGSKNEQTMTFAAGKGTQDTRTDDLRSKTESTQGAIHNTNGNIMDTFERRYLMQPPLQVIQEGSRSELQLRENGCRRAGMQHTLFGSNEHSKEGENLQIPKQLKDEVANILINSKQSAVQHSNAQNLLQMTHSSQQSARNVEKPQSGSAKSGAEKSDAKVQQVSFQAAQSSPQDKNESSGQTQQKSMPRAAHANKQPVRSDKENQQRPAEHSPYQQTVTTMQQLAQAVTHSAPQPSRRMTTAKRERKVKPEKKENTVAVEALLRQTAEEMNINRKPEQVPAQNTQVKKEEQRQALAPANGKHQPKEPAAAQESQPAQDPLNDSMVFSQKASLEDYIIGKQIGQGAYAVVRAGIHRPTNRKVAMKIYKKYKLEEPNRRKSVKREIKLMEKMKHGHIIQLYEIIDNGKYVILIMEYVSNGSLHGYLKSKPNRRLEEWDAKRIFKQIVEGIRYCHSRCITHRDIKLENLLLDDANAMKIIDFGFSTCIPNDRKVKIFCGTPSYMAPEIVLKTEYCGPPADIWALGVLLFTILSGQFPYRGATDEELYDKICRADYHLPKEVKESLSPAAKDLLAKLFTLKADDRPTAQQILEHQWLYYVSEKKEAVPSLQAHNDSICQIMPYENPSKQRAKSQKEAMAPKNKISAPAPQPKEAINPFVIEQQEQQINEQIIQIIAAKVGYSVNEVREQVIEDLKRRANRPAAETGSSYVTNFYLRMLEEGDAREHRLEQHLAKSQAAKSMVNQALRGTTTRCSETAATEPHHSEAKSLPRSANGSQFGASRYTHNANQTQQLMLKSALSQTSLGFSANGANMLSQGLGQNAQQNVGIQPSYVPSLKSLGSNGGTLLQTAGNSFQAPMFNNTLTTPFQGNAIPVASAGNSHFGALSNFNNTQPINFAALKEGSNLFKDSSVDDGSSSCRTRQQTVHQQEAGSASQVNPEAMNILQMHQTNIFVNAGANFPPQPQPDAFNFYQCTPSSQDHHEVMTEFDNPDSTVMSKKSAKTINGRAATSAGGMVRRKQNCWVGDLGNQPAVYEEESTNEQVSPDFKQRLPTRVKSGMRI